MTAYHHKKLRPWSLIAWSLRSLANLLRLWPLLAIAVWAASPVTLHLRWSYAYRDIGTYRVYTACTYLGPQGFIRSQPGETCPVFTLIDVGRAR
ncbi:MAG: hypothetical protein KDH88_19750 [Chromatiales bacterium]|nr:hypothetical protein [Chromatiales bacterium]